MGHRAARIVKGAAGRSEDAARFPGYPRPGRGDLWMKDGETAAPSIFIVDDERRLAAILKENLERQGYRVDCAYTGPDAVDFLEERRPSLVILDIMLPKMNGFAVCEHIRVRSQVPILMLTARDAEEDKLRGFELGADDYLTKPFSTKELLARVRALLRRAPASEDLAMIRDGDLELDPQSRTIRKGGELVELSVREFDLLFYLMRRPGQLVSREQLLSDVWGYEFLGDSARTVDVTIWRLRSKIEKNPREPRHILSRRGFGYLYQGQE